MAKHLPSSSVDESNAPAFESLYAFWHNAREQLNELRTITVFRDGRIALDGTFYTVEQVFQWIKDGTLRASPRENELLVIVRVGIYRIHVERQVRFDHEFGTLLLDTLARLRGAPDSLARCRAATINFVKTGSVESLEVLKATYEAVPTATRFAVLADMDLKNKPLERLFNGNDKEKESAIQELSVWARQWTEK